MKRFGISVSALMCFAALSLPCVAQANPWNGSWKIDPSTIKYDGVTFSVTIDPDGFTVSSGGKADPKVICDGKPQTTPTGASATCVKIDTGYQIDVSRNGKTVRKETITMSADGMTSIRKMEMFPPDDSPYTMTTTAKKISGGPTSSVWKETGIEESQDTGILTIEVSGDSVAFKETDNDKPVMSKMDGSETKVSEKGTMAVKLVNPRTLTVTYRIGGEVRRVNTFVLSKNGKTIEETDVTPEPAASKVSMLFHKS